MIAAILEDNDWPADALATIISISNHQDRFTADDLVWAMRKPPHPNQVGAVFVAARNLGYIEPVGYQISHTPSRKHGVVRQWRRKINEGVGQHE